MRADDGHRLAGRQREQRTTTQGATKTPEVVAGDHGKAADGIIDPCIPRRTRIDHAEVTADGSRRGGLSEHRGRRDGPDPMSHVDVNQQRRASQDRTPSTIDVTSRSLAVSLRVRCSWLSI